VGECTKAQSDSLIIDCGQLLRRREACSYLMTKECQKSLNAVGTFLAIFPSTRTGPRLQPKKSPARPPIVSLRKQNHFISLGGRAAASI